MVITMNELLEQLDSLGDRDVEKVLKLIQKLSAKRGKRHVDIDVEVEVDAEPEKPTIVQAKEQAPRPKSGPIGGRRASAPRQIKGNENRQRADRAINGNKGARRKPPVTTEMELGPRPNLFLTQSAKLLGVDGKQAHKDDTLIDKKLNKNAPVPRRGIANLVEVECAVCGRVESIAASMAPFGESRYKCNDCAGGPGYK